MKLTLIGTLFGIELPSDVKELHLGKGRVFKNAVAAGGSQSVTFSVTKEVAGSYSVAVDGLSGSLTAVAPAPTPPPAPLPEVKPPINWPILGGVIDAVVVGLLVLFLIRRKVA